MFDWLDQAQYLCHYGVGHLNGGHSGRYPWGSGTRPMQSENLGIKAMAKQDMKDAKIRNLDKWGTSPENNVLYIAGISGSGKSTVALAMKRKNDTVIHLDGYSESKEYLHDIQNKRFNAFLDKNVSGWQYIYMDPLLTKAKQIAYWDKVDEFNNAINKFARKEYNDGRRVIVEGVQISTGWLSDNDYQNKPYIELTTDVSIADKRASERDKEY